MLSYPSTISLSSRTLHHLANRIRSHRDQRRSRWRRLDAGRQALLAVAHLRNGDTYTRLAAGFQIGVSTAWRYVQEAIALLAQAARVELDGDTFHQAIRKHGWLARLDRAGRLRAGTRPCDRHCFQQQRDLLKIPEWVKRASFLSYLVTKLSVVSRKKEQPPRQKRRSGGRQHDAGSTPSVAAQLATFERRATRTAEAVSELVGSSESWEDAAAKAGDVIRRVVSELADVMAPWHAFDVLAWLQRSNAASAETYQESTHEGLSALVELAGLILMERSSPEPIAAPPGTDERVDAVEVAELCRRLDSGLRQILAAGQLLNLARHVSDDTGWELRYHLVEREMLLRNLGYPHLQERLLRGLFGAPDIVSALSATLGFTIDDALAVVAGLQQRIENAYWDGILAGHKHLRASHDNAKTGADATTRRRQAKTAANSHAHSRALADAAAIVSDRLGQRVAVTANELSSATGVDNTAVKAVLQLMSRPLGGTAAAHLVERYLHGDNALRVRAVLHDPDHGYFPVSIGNLLFGLREMIEDALKVHPAFTAYAKHRGDWVERAASDALQEVIRPEQIYRNIEFVADDGKAVESDALLVCDRVAMAVEAKAVALSPRARSGDRARVRRDMSRIVADTVHQADRLRHAITSDGHLRVRGQDQANIDLSDVRRVFPIAVTLEDVTSVTGSAAGFVDAGILPSRRGLPLIVSLHDLWVICEVVEGPAQLMHYLRQHEETVTLGLVTASEELDLFMTYLNQGLYFGDYLDADGNPTTEFFTLSMTDTLDAYYLHQTGQRKAVAEKPRQAWSPKAFRELVRHLEQHRPAGWATACLNMFEGDRGARNQIATMMRRLARRTRLDGLPHDEMRLFGRSQPGAFGVTGMSVPPRDDIEVLRIKLLTLCRARKYMARTSSWTGIGVVSNAPSTVAVLVQLDEPWTPDPAMDQLVEQMGLRPFDEVATSRA